MESDPAALRMLLDEARLERDVMVGRAKRLRAKLDAARAHAAELERFAEEYAPSAYEVWKSELER